MEHHEGGDTLIKGVMKSHIKGKRTKRRRPSSALTLTLASTTSSSTTSETSASANHNGLFRMPSTSSIEFTNIFQDNHTNNDQDIANCLMLLAHGHHPPPPRSYVYECKTCDRGFTSFQALGGHRASHNKPPKDVHVHELSKNKTSILNSPNKPLSCYNTNGSTKGTKVHECSICGSEFTSGQALGGHMRRHRSMTMANTSNAHHESKKHKTGLPLDLNLPAPTEDEHKEITHNSFGSNNQIIVFSAPALVDCKGGSRNLYTITVFRCSRPRLVASEYL